MDKHKELDLLYQRTQQILAPHVRFGQVVFGTGDPDAPLCLVGEAPGKNEAEQGVPFVGQAGKNLDALLAAHGISRNDVYITNIVKYRPVSAGAKPGTFRNRTPKREELSLCRSLLMEELQILSPKVVATLGNSPLHAITQDSQIVIGEVHGAPLELGDLPFILVPLYHPASVIYNRELQPTLDRDLESVAQLLRSL